MSKLSMYACGGGAVYSGRECSGFLGVVSNTVILQTEKSCS